MPERCRGSTLMTIGPEAHRRRFVAAALTAAWVGFCYLSYTVAAARAEECLDELSGGQQDICIRHAIEARDNVLFWGLGIPLGLLIVTAFVDHVRQRR